MKKLFSVFTAFIIFATIFTSCEKQSFENPENQKENKILTINDLPNFKTEQGILVFKNQKDFEKSTNIL